MCPRTSRCSSASWRRVLLASLLAAATRAQVCFDLTTHSYANGTAYCNAMAVLRGLEPSWQCFEAGCASDANGCCFDCSVESCPPVVSPPPPPNCYGSGSDDDLADGDEYCYATYGEDWRCGGEDGCETSDGTECCVDCKATPCFEEAEEEEEGSMRVLRVFFLVPLGCAVFFIVICFRRRAEMRRRALQNAARAGGGFSMTATSTTGVGAVAPTQGMPYPAQGVPASGQVVAAQGVPVAQATTAAPMVVICPRGTRPGDQMTVDMPGRGQCVVTVPPGVAEGGQFRVTMPAVPVATAYIVEGGPVA